MSFLALVFRHPILAAKTMGDILSDFIKLLVGGISDLATGIGSALMASLRICSLKLMPRALLLGFLPSAV